MKRLFLILSIAAGLAIAGCSSEESGHTHDEEGNHTHETEQHAHDDPDTDHQHVNEEEHTHSEDEEGHSHSGEDSHTHEEEASETELERDDTYDEVRRGVRLTLSYDSETESFTGTIENTTQDGLPQVSVKVELSNGTELGPTTSVDLESGESQSIELDAAGETFDRWSAHSEMGSGGHSHGEDGEHQQ